MAFDLGTGFDGIDLSTITSGSDQAVLPDVSYGAPAEQPSTPVGNGSGQWITGFLDKALNYAMYQDQQTMGPPQYATRPPVNVQPSTPQSKAASNKMLLLIGGGVLLVLLLERKA